MKLWLIHGKTSSAIVADDVTIEYTRKIHRFESENDYKLIVTELNTYGVNAATEVFNYLVTSKREAA